MIQAMAIVIASWALLFCLIAGLGRFVFTLFKVNLPDGSAWFRAFWIGYAVIIAALYLWNFALPIDWRLCLVLGIAGGAGFVWGPQWIRPQRAAILRFVVLILLLAPIAIWVANRALNPALDFDTGLYHLSSIHWSNAYPVVPGLGNLHYRLAFNQSFFLFVALLNIYPYFNEGFHIANSFLLMVLIAQLLYTVIAAPSRQNLPYRLLSALLIPVMLYRATPQPYSANISSPSPDLSIFIFQVVVLLEFVRYLFEGQALPDSEQGLSVFFVIALSAVGITSKLSFAGFGVIIVVMSVLVWLFRHRDEIGLALRRAVIWLAVVGTLIGLTWAAHGSITSGYPLFPSSLGALPVDWRIPPDTTKEAEDWIYSFARKPHGEISVVLSSWDWVQSWWPLMQDSFNQFLFTYPFIAFTITIPAYIVLVLLFRYVIFRKRRRPYDFKVWLPLLPAIVSGLFWFFTAPDPRFAGSSFWLLALWSVILIITLIKPIKPVVYIVLLLPLGLAALLLVNQFTDNFNLDGTGFPPLPVAPMTAFHTASGLIVNIPADDNNPLQLWDAPLPASPYTYPQLSLRDNSLAAGFRMLNDTSSNAADIPSSSKAQR